MDKSDHNKGCKLEKKNNFVWSGHMVLEEMSERRDEIEGIFHSQNSVNPEIIMDTGSTLSLFKDKSFLENILVTKQSLLMKKNCDKKVIHNEVEVPGTNITVHFDKGTITNLYSLKDLKAKCRVRYDSWNKDKSWPMLLTNG